MIAAGRRVEAPGRVWPGFSSEEVISASLEQGTLAVESGLPVQDKIPFADSLSPVRLDDAAQGVDGLPLATDRSEYWGVRVARVGCEIDVL